MRRHENCNTVEKAKFLFRDILMLQTYISTLKSLWFFFPSKLGEECCLVCCVGTRHHFSATAKLTQETRGMHLILHQQRTLATHMVCFSPLSMYEISSKCHTPQTDCLSLCLGGLSFKSRALQLASSTFMKTEHGAEGLI